MKIALVKRMRKAQEAVSFTASDMAQWFGVRRVTMVKWLGNYDANPLPGKRPQLEQELILLERAIISRKFPDRLPVPLSITQFDRATFIARLKADATRQFSKSHPAAGRGKVLGHNKKQGRPSELRPNT